MAAAEQLALPIPAGPPWRIRDVLIDDETMSEARRRGFRELRTYRDAFEFEAAMIADTEPMPCPKCKRRDAHQELRTVDIHEWPMTLAWWRCVCGTWGLPVIADPLRIRRYYERQKERTDA